MQNVYRFIFLICISVNIMSCQSKTDSSKNPSRRNYYLNQFGDDAHAGTLESPWKTIAKLNTITFAPGDSVFFESGQSFQGTLRLDSSDSGTEGRPVVITSSNATKAILLAKDSTALTIRFAKFIRVHNLHLKGSGRKKGNVKSGIEIENESSQLKIDSLEVEGFQKAGVLVYHGADVLIENVYAHDNGASGIELAGDGKKSDNQRITIRYCTAENNPGDPTNFTNHSGNGILVGYTTNAVVENCVATNNGWDMPRIGNGPVGIWMYEADHVIIQNCISYRNKTSKGGEDGGGFDIDGGVTNSTIQYCLSYENEGSGFGIFQYNGASAWRNNTIRFNISENDGTVSRAHAGPFIWNGSDDRNHFTDFFCYNNVIYNSIGTAIHFDEHSLRDRFHFYNNIFVGGKQLILGRAEKDLFVGNNWWSIADGFNVNGETDFRAWSNKTGFEKINNSILGTNVRPDFENLSANSIAKPFDIPSYRKYALLKSSVLRTNGINLKTEFGIDNGGKDFNNRAVPEKGIGASF